MQLAAFLCVICAICGRIHIQTYSINIHKRNPNKSPADHADYADEPQNNINHKTQNNINLILSNLSTMQWLTRTGIH